MIYAGKEMDFRIKRRLVIVFFGVFMCSNILAQKDSIPQDSLFVHIISSDWIDKGLVMGVDFSYFLYGEVDYYQSYVLEAGGFPTLSTTMNYGAEFSYFDKFILAPKIQARIHAYFFNASLSALFYTDLKEGYAIKLRPEVGVGLWNVDINYGYNIGVYKNNFNQYNRHVIVLRYYLRLHRKFLNEYDRNGNQRPFKR